MTIYVVKGQDSIHCYYKGQKIPLQFSTQELYIGLDSTFSDTVHFRKHASFEIHDQHNSRHGYHKRWAHLQFAHSLTKSEYLAQIDSLRKISGVKYIAPYITTDSTPRGKPYGTTNIFYIKLKQLSDSSLLKSYSREHGVEVIERNRFMPLWFTLSCNDTILGSSIKQCNTFYNSGLFADIDPSFMFHFTTECTTSDPQFSQQWGLQNSTFANVDIDACDAWNVSTGVGTKVAVIDWGIDMTHDDLAANIYPDSL